MLAILAENCMLRYCPVKFKVEVCMMETSSELDMFMGL